MDNESREYTDGELYRLWLGEMCLLERPGAIKQGARWQKMFRLLMYLATQYGWMNDGKSMFPSLDTLARVFETDSRTVRRWLRDAVDLGIIKVAEQATPKRPVTYAVVPFWESGLDLPDELPVDEPELASQVGAPTCKHGPMDCKDTPHNRMWLCPLNLCRVVLEPGARPVSVVGTRT